MNKLYNIFGLFIATYTLTLLIYGIIFYGSTFPQPTLSFKQITPIGVKDIIFSLGVFLWDYRALDLIMLIGVLFASAVGCIAMLRLSEGER